MIRPLMTHENFRRIDIIIIWNKMTAVFWLLGFSTECFVVVVHSVQLEEEQRRQNEKF